MPRPTPIPSRFPIADAGKRAEGFTLLEVLTATTILAIILVLVYSVLNHSIGVWRRANANIDAFQNARAVFDIMTTRLSQATLNTYWDYYDASHTAFRDAANTANFVPKYYGRQADLHFISGQAKSLIPTPPPGYASLATQAVFFTAPTGLTADKNYQPLPELLSACGFFVAFGGDSTSRPSILTAPATYRWRLMELTAPVESAGIYKTGSTSWFTGPIQDGEVRPIAENIIALVIWPRLAPLSDPAGTSIAPDYAYDTRTAESWSGSRQPVQTNQLPPTVQVTMVAIDEGSAARLQSGGTPPGVITTALAGRFQKASQYEQDLADLESALTDNRITYRVFTSTVTLTESQWSQ